MIGRLASIRSGKITRGNVHEGWDGMKKLITIPMGPQHPVFKEPMRLDITLDGEVVVDVDIIISYPHRGVEKATESRNYIQNLYLVERVCGICSHHHVTCYCQAVEELLGLQIPERARLIRTLMGELERIQSHYLWLGIAAHEIGWDTVLMYTWRDRERVNDLLEMISGNRVHYAMNTIGGVRRDIPEVYFPKIQDGLSFFQDRTEYYLTLIKEEESYLKRTVNIGHLSTETAKRLCAVGPTLRASNVRFDVRADDPYAAYHDLDFEVITTDTCDVWGRGYVKVMEIFQCLRICRQILEKISPGEIRVKAPAKVPTGEAISRVEAPRGELLYYVKSNGSDRPERVKIRSPTLANWLATAEMLKGVYIADVPIVVDAIDPCLSCTARCSNLQGPGRGPEAVNREDPGRLGR
jgi:membrane-bound hydrogenase subunit alpha